MPDHPLRPDQHAVLTTSRRRFLTLAGGGGLATAAALAGFSTSPAQSTPIFPNDPFSLGVASGDPLPDGVVLWTRLAPDPLAADGRGGMTDRAVPVQWQIAEDPSFHRVVQAGTQRSTPEFGHSVHVEVSGLRPDREYWYRFRAGRELSQTGRTRTAAAAGAALSSLSFAFASCQNYPDGYFTAFRHMAEEDLDLVIHLGDYIYEGTAQGSIGRGHLPTTECFSLEDYRVRYGQYKSDPDLQACHAAFPWVVVMDDHEVDNNWAGDLDGHDVGGAEFLARRSAAFQAYYENMPLRRASLPAGPDMQLYRRLSYGDLATFNVLDTRQYRSNQACGDGLKVPCEEAYDPSRTTLGEEQEQWLLDDLAGSTTSWNVLAQQMIMAKADRDPGEGELLPMDNWNGYEPARQRLFDGIMEHGVENVVVVTGDAHCSMVTDLKADFEDAASQTVGAEFLGTSISSGRDGQDMDGRGEDWLAANPHMKYYNQRRGYVRCVVTPEQWRTDYRVLPYVSRPGAPIATDASFVVENGVPGIQPA